jgi:uncharacterized membrane protein YdjX (TVP38/TMEM64 family)
MTKTNLIRLSAIVAFTIAMVLTIELAGLRENFSLDYLRATIEANLFIGIAIFIVMFAVANLIQVPGWIFMVAAFLTLGKVAGGVVTYVAAVLSCIVTYGIIGYIGQDALRSIDNKLAKKLLSYLDTHPMRAIVLLRVVFGTVPILNYTLALSGVKFKQYVAATAIGLFFPIFIHALLFEFLALHLFDVTV